MSIGSLGIIGSLAGTALPQRAADVAKTESGTTDQARAQAAEEKAENAAGIGETEEDSQASERDADGRRPWEIAAQKKPAPDSPAAEDAAAQLSKDPTGEAGGQLDLVG